MFRHAYQNGKLLREIPYYKFLEVITNSHMTNTCFNIIKREIPHYKFLESISHITKHYKWSDFLLMKSFASFYRQVNKALRCIFIASQIEVNGHVPA